MLTKHLELPQLYEKIQTYFGIDVVSEALFR